MAYDPECEKLVDYFLQDEPAELKADRSFAATVAQDIQTMIEDSIELWKSEQREKRQQPGD